MEETSDEFLKELRDAVEFDYNELDGKLLRIHVYNDEDGQVIVGHEEETNHCYILGMNVIEEVEQ